MDKKAILILEDGTLFEGKSLGISKDVSGPLIINTAVVGYQEMITDPANSGKLLTLTYPLIGNYGVNEKFNESENVWISGLVIKEDSHVYSNWQASEGLCEFLKKNNVAAISDVDTRTLMVKLRSAGEILGMISSSDINPKGLLKKLGEFKQKKKESFLTKTSVKKITKIEGRGQRIVIIDLGILKSILRQLATLGLEVIRVPYDTKAQDILNLKPKGVIISSGPEDDPQLSKVVNTIEEILGKIPLLGISCGHEVIAQAIGAKIVKMKLGHHGLNYPVKRADSLKGEITVQNHSWVVDGNSFKQKKDIQITERNINDQTIEKIRSENLKFISIQYYPLSPGLDEVHPVFGEFLDLIKKE